MNRKIGFLWLGAGFVAFALCSMAHAADPVVDSVSWVKQGNAHATLVREAGGSKTELSRYVGMSRTRIGQFLSLMRLPAETRRQLRGQAGLTEYHLRRRLGGIIGNC